MHSNNSFDVFDTLLARRQIFPKLLFNDVERETGVVGFSQVRIDAEKKLSKYNYNIDDIYNVLGANFDPATTRKLREAEFGIESRSLFPIVENLSRVTEGDILVSDTYLPADFIREILHRFGATPNFTLYTSANGKKNGWMWCHLSGTYQIQQHHGDNVLSDYIQPMKFSIPAQLCTFSQPLPEKHLLFPETIDLIRSVRQARLQNPHTDYYDRQVWTFACTSLFPILISICLWLRQIQKEGNFQNVLFCSRDAFYLYKIFHAIADDVSSGYLLTSRESRLQSHQSYLDYLDGMIAGKSTLVVDLIGTGLTLTKLRDRLRNGGSFRIAIPFLIKQTKITRYRRLYSQSHRDDGIYYIGYMDDYNVQGGLFEEVAAPPQAHFVNTIHRFGNEIGKLFSKENQEGQRKRQIISGAIDECIKVFIDKPFFLSPQVTTNCLRNCFDVMKLYRAFFLDFLEKHEREEKLYELSLEHRQLFASNTAPPNPYVYRAINMAGAELPAVPMTLSETYSQAYEDVLVVSLLRTMIGRKKLTSEKLNYIEIGANQPHASSNTYLIRKHFHSKGILVEADPELCAVLAHHRPNDIVVHSAVITSDTQFVDFFKSNVNELSSTDLGHVDSFGDFQGMACGVEKLRVPATRINTILEEYFSNTTIHYLSIDTEGKDFEIVSDIDFRRFSPWIISIEPSDHYLEGNSEKIFKFLCEQGYELVGDNGINLIFALRSALKKAN